MLHRLVEQLARRAHRRPDHLGKTVHVLAAFLGQAENVGQDLEHERLRHLGHSIDGVPLAQPVEQFLGALFEHAFHPFERARRKRIGDHLAHLRVAGRIVGQQDLGPRARRIVPRARGAGEGLPVEQPAGDVLVPGDHHHAVVQPHRGGELAQRVVDLARVAHRVGGEDVERIVGDVLAQSPSPRNQVCPLSPVSMWPAVGSKKCAPITITPLSLYLSTKPIRGGAPSFLVHVEGRLAMRHRALHRVVHQVAGDHRVLAL